MSIRVSRTQWFLGLSLFSEHFYSNHRVTWSGKEMVTITVYRTRLCDTKYKRMSLPRTLFNLKMKRGKEMVKFVQFAECRSGIVGQTVGLARLHGELESYMKFSIIETVKILVFSRILLRFTIRQLLRALVNRSTLRSIKKRIKLSTINAKTLFYVKYDRGYYYISQTFVKLLLVVKVNTIEVNTTIGFTKNRNVY